MATLPDFLTDQTEEVILQRMLSNVPADLDTSEGSYIWDSLSPVAIELALAYIQAQEILKRGFIATTYGEYLKLKAAEDGIETRSAVSATGTIEKGNPLKIVGTPGANFSVGIAVATPADLATGTVSIEFTTIGEVTLDVNGIGYADIKAVVPGKSGNVSVGAISILTKPISGIKSVTNEKPTTGGLDEEDKELLRERILKECQKDEGDGNSADYEIWAKEVAGVGNVLVEPLWQGEGTVRVVILDPDGRDAPKATVDAVQNHLDPGSLGLGEGKAPIGARVTVVTAEVITINATIPGLTVGAGYTLDQGKTNAEISLSNYFKKINPGGIIRTKKAEAEITNALGVLDMGDLLLDGKRDNIVLGITQLAALGSVIYV
ncbi:Baseplate J family protein [Desulfofarcimen acetoxidans DSM 771]|uniref:Baseplate J family protein n=1 Tax=Desulfofarcimen acetoxidans (strain ATCC 49208 / DSM 771 / KCTC 5769 / VKM B-1644 / 5575) TaxID=485916 RepID=C8VZH2_DESAS|nr:baseplate J/gp47 family protein [Desulfofarcimen acetoxidans]ACV64917.1 Baseplate J family protein [Desulfofarcimen acetoxidans DSM 771]